MQIRLKTKETPIVVTYCFILEKKRSNISVSIQTIETLPNKTPITNQVFILFSLQ